MQTSANQTKLFYYSPTGTSKKIAHAVCKGIASIHLSATDLTFSEAKAEQIQDNQLAVFVMPVYAGRIAPTALQRISGIQGQNTPAVAIVVYGNRHYDDALLELCDVLKKKGFTPIAAAAFIGEHSFSRKEMPVAAGRPDECDLSIATQFGEKIAEKLQSGNFNQELTVPGNYPYKEARQQPPMAPESTDDCNLCGTCMDICPTHAISLSNDRIVTDTSACTLCCACVKYCPQEARIFNTPFTKFLYENFSQRREPELYL